MRKPALPTLMAAAALTLAACESASLTPEVRTAPAPVSVPYDALLGAMNAGREATPQQRQALLMLAEAFGRRPAGLTDGSAREPSLSPAAQAALRDFAAAPSDAEMLRALERLTADLAATPTR